MRGDEIEAAVNPFILHHLIQIAVVQRHLGGEDSDRGRDGMKGGEEAEYLQRSVVLVLVTDVLLDGREAFIVVNVVPCRERFSGRQLILTTV
jgi:hypothetical protein